MSRARAQTDIKKQSQASHLWPVIASANWQNASNEGMKVFLSFSFSFSFPLPFPAAQSAKEEEVIQKRCPLIIDVRIHPLLLATASVNLYFLFYSTDSFHPAYTLIFSLSLCTSRDSTINPLLIQSTFRVCLLCMCLLLLFSSVQ